jgi:hypothetical protein
MPKPPNVGKFLPFFPEEFEEASAALKKATQFAVGVVVAVKLADRFPKLVPVTEFFTGLKVIPKVGVKVTPGVLGFFAPQPFGLVPAQAFGMTENQNSPFFYLRELGPEGRAQNEHETKTIRDGNKLRFLLRRQADREHMSDERLLHELAVQQKLIDRQPRRATVLNGLYTQDLANTRQQAIDRGLIAGLTSDQLAAQAPARDGTAVGFNEATLSPELIAAFGGIAAFVDALLANNPPDP